MKLYVNVTKKVFAEKLRHPSSQNFPLSKISETSNGLPGELFLRNENFSKVFCDTSIYSTTSCFASNICAGTELYRSTKPTPS